MKPLCFEARETESREMPVLLLLLTSRPTPLSRILVMNAMKVAGCLVALALVEVGMERRGERS